MKNALIAASLVALAASSAIRITAEEDANGVVFKSRTELMSVLAERAKASPAPEMMAANVKSGDHFMINVVRRTKAQGAIAHDVGSEIHSVIDGNATLVTGGKIVRPSANPSDRGNGKVENGVSHHVGAGDVVFVPPQTPHWYRQIDGVVTYLEIRFDVGAPAGGPATYLPLSEIKTVLAGKAAATPAPLLFDAPLTRGEKFQANVVARTKPQGGGAHALGTEVHHILEGSGTFVTGGRIVRPSGGTGPATIEGGQSRHVAAGDVVLIPANTPHWYKAIDGGSIRYLEVRFELPKS
jgi:mannose-6-phosphate isomerase-like protein (cupin superfamily)